jgi:hypothetical protein
MVAIGSLKVMPCSPAYSSAAHINERPHFTTLISAVVSNVVSEAWLSLIPQPLYPTLRDILTVFLAHGSILDIRSLGARWLCESLATRRNVLNMRMFEF